MPSDLINILFPMLGVTVGVLTSIISMFNVNKKSLQEEKKEIETSLNDIIDLSNNKKDNIIDLMLMNIKELREYYAISKIQARKSFVAALFVCFMGVVIYILGIVATIVYKIDITIITLISGTIVEVIAGSFFWLHHKSIKQLNLYHQRLGYTEKYLTVIQIINTMSEDKQDEEYRNLINFILSDNSKVMQSEIINESSIK